jgi:hypothetical protein
VGDRRRAPRPISRRSRRRQRIVGSTAAEVNVFSSALAALSGYKAIGAYEAGRTTKLASASVIVYFKQLPASRRSKIEACS